MRDWLAGGAFVDANEAALGPPARLQSRLSVVALLCAALAALLTAIALSSAAPAPPVAMNDAEVRAAYGELPLSFVANRGQIDKPVRYYAEAPGLGVFLTENKAVLSLAKGKRGVALEMRFPGASADARLEPGRRGEGKINHLTGSARHTGLAPYGQVTYRDLWPGIDMVFRGQGGTLKYEFHVAPGADPSRIGVAYRGAEGLSLGAAGNLLIATPLGTLRDARPVSYQRIGGKRVAVESRYALKGSSAYGFALGRHDPGRPLVIDPATRVTPRTSAGTTRTGPAGSRWMRNGNAYVSRSTRLCELPHDTGCLRRD